MNRTLIEAARTMLADSHLPTTFWAEAVNTTCYTFNRVRVTKPQNRFMLEFCGEKGIKQEFSNARTPQQNGVAERMNRTLIEAARTMLADSHLPTTFWAEAVNTACYTFNRGTFGRENFREKK
ncbi:ribonuclease H-like domain-containing protein [Tanacetum coccineum]